MRKTQTGSVSPSPSRMQSTRVKWRCVCIVCMYDVCIIYDVYIRMCVYVCMLSMYACVCLCVRVYYSGTD